MLAKEAVEFTCTGPEGKCLIFNFESVKTGAL